MFFTLCVIIQRAKRWGKKTLSRETRKKRFFIRNLIILSKREKDLFHRRIITRGIEFELFCRETVGKEDRVFLFDMNKGCVPE